MAHLKQILSILITTGLSQDTYLMAKILHFCAITPSGDLHYASLLFDRIQEPDAFIWNSMIRGFSIGPQPRKSIAFFVGMCRNSVVPDRHTFPSLLKAFSKSPGENPNQIHGQVVKFGLDSDVFVRNSLISAYANCGKLGHARQPFGESTVRDPVAWTAMIDGCVRSSRPVESLDLFLEMRLRGVEIDGVTVVSVLCALGIVGVVWMGRWIHGFYGVCGRVIFDVFLGGALVDMYAKCGYCDDARKLFDEMPCKNAVSWSVLIAGYVQSNRFKEALVVFQDMLVEDVRPNQPTLASTLTACAQLGAVDQGRWIHTYIRKSKVEMNLTLGTTLIHMYAKCGCIEEAFLVFQSLTQKDVYPWTAMINGLALHGHALRSLDLFSQMLSEGVQPNAVTFIGVLSACSHGGLVDKGRMYFECMDQVYGIKRNIEHYGCMVDLLGRAGHLEEALNLIKRMPMETSAGVWGALFGACMIHKDFRLGEQVGKHLIKLQPHHSGRYALLANMYTISQKWEEAAHVRKLMKGERVEKAPGCSWIQIGGAIHEFIALDKSHSKSKDIYVLLDGITAQLKLAACAPDIAQYLFDLDPG